MIDNFETGMTLGEISKHLGVSESRIAQVEQRAIRKLWLIYGFREQRTTSYSWDEFREEGWNRNKWRKKKAKA